MRIAMSLEPMDRIDTGKRTEWIEVNKRPEVVIQRWDLHAGRSVCRKPLAGTSKADAR